MTAFEDYLANKRIAAQRRRERAIAGEIGPKRLLTTTRVQHDADSSGVIGNRITQIRGHEIVTDSGPDLGGFDAGPTPVELLLSAIGGCLAHTFMMQASARRISFTDLEVDVSATMDPRSGTPGFESVPNYPTDITIDVRVTSGNDERLVNEAIEAAERGCPVSAILRVDVSLRTSAVITRPEIPE